MTNNALIESLKNVAIKIDETMPNMLIKDLDPQKIKLTVKFQEI